MLLSKKGWSGKEEMKKKLNICSSPGILNQTCSFVGLLFKKKHSIERKVRLACFNHFAGKTTKLLVHYTHTHKFKQTANVHTSTANKSHQLLILQLEAATLEMWAVCTRMCCTRFLNIFICSHFITSAAAAREWTWMRAAFLSESRKLTHTHSHSTFEKTFTCSSSSSCSRISAPNLLARVVYGLCVCVCVARKPEAAADWHVEPTKAKQARQTLKNVCSECDEKFAINSLRKEK